MRKVVIAGGTGFIGSYLSKRFKETGYKVVIVSRDAEHVSWRPLDLVEAINGADLIINLAGKSINCRHTEINKKVILESRLNTTLWIGNAALSCNKPPKLWINASATGIYKPSTERAMTEDETELGNDFLAEVVKRWEKVFFGFRLFETRKIALRTSVVLGKDGGTLSPLVWLSRLGLGGKQSDGTQIFSWIHIEDYFQSIIFLIDNHEINGAVNCTSPDPVSNKDFMQAIRKTLNIPIGISAPEFAVNLGAKILGTEPELILNSCFVIPKRLLDSGFKFTFPETDKALVDLLK